jgi:hypothetical protein
MPVKLTTITERKLLLGEGVDEVRFFTALLKRLTITGIQVHDYGGKTKLRDFLEALRLIPGFADLASLAITRDADSEANGAFASVRASLENAGLPAPAGHNQPAAGSTLTVRVWIMPDGNRPGMLEDLCMDAVQADPASPCVEAYFKCLRDLGRPECTPGNMAKARTHAWLASRPEPDRRLAEAAEQGYWPWDDLAFRPIIDFVRSL